MTAGDICVVDSVAMLATPPSYPLAMESNEQLALTITFDPAINYAFQQNAIPVVKELRFQNDGLARNNLVIRVITEPAFAESVEIRLQSIAAGGEYRRGVYWDVPGLWESVGVCGGVCEVPRVRV